MKRLFLIILLFMLTNLCAGSTRDDAINYFKKKSQNDPDIVFLSIKDLSINYKGQDDIYKSIGLSSKIVNDKDLMYIIYFPELEALHLGGSNITDKGLKYLSNLPKLRILNIDKTSITDDGLKYLKDLKSLKELDLFYTKVTDKGIQELASVKSLRLLMLHGTKVTQKGIDELKKKLPKCDITLASKEELQ